MQIRSLAGRRRNILRFGCSAHFSAFVVMNLSLSGSETGIYRSTVRAGRDVHPAMRYIRGPSRYVRVRPPSSFLPRID